MLLFALSTLALSGLGAAQTTDVCPPTVPRDEYLKVYGDACYQFVTYRQRSYSQADQDCRSHGGSLALVKSQDLTDYIVDQLLYEYGYGAKLWIGLNDKETEGTFMWEDGTALGFSNFELGQGQYSTTNNQDCVTLVPGLQGQWNDDICEDGFFGFVHHRYAYICQYHESQATTVVAPSGTCPPFHCDIDCGEEVYIKDPDSGCPICQCGSE